MSGPVEGAQRSLQKAWVDMTQAERDAAYDNRNAVANAGELLAGWTVASQAYRAAHAGHLDVPYGPGERQKMDLYPATDPAAACLVFIHGGYWQRNSRELFAHFATGAAALGWSVAMPSHTLAPDASLAEIVAEIGLALDWLAAHGPTHGIAGPIILSGWSAGAHLTAMHLGHPSVTGGLAISGVYELGPIRDTYLNAALNLTDEEIATLSPLRLPVVMKPMVITYGANELPALVWDSRDLHSLRATANAPSALVPIDGADHFTIMDQLLDPQGQVFGLVTMMVR